MPDHRQVGLRQYRQNDVPVPAVPPQYLVLVQTHPRFRGDRLCPLSSSKHSSMAHRAPATLASFAKAVPAGSCRTLCEPENQRLRTASAFRRSSPGATSASCPSGKTSTPGEDSTAAKFFYWSMLAQGAYQLDSASERIRLGLDRARASGKRVGRPLALTHEQAEQCRRMAIEGAGLREIARVMGCSPGQVKRMLGPGGE